MDSEPITLQKFFSGLLSLKTGVKALAFLPWLLVFLFIGFLIWNTFFKQAKPTQDITVESGGSVIIKNEAAKKRLVWFVEPWVGSSSQEKWDGGIRTGIRIEFP